MGLYFAQFTELLGLLTEAPNGGMGEGKGWPLLSPVVAETKGSLNNGRPPVLS